MPNQYLKLLIEQYWKIYHGLPNDKKDQMEILWTYIKGHYDEIAFSNEKLDSVEKELARIGVQIEKNEVRTEIESRKLADEYGNNLYNKLEKVTRLVYAHPRWVGLGLLILGNTQIDLINKFRPNDKSPKESLKDG